MQRKIEIKSGPIKVTALIDTDELSRDEMEEARDDLADRLIAAVADTKFLQMPHCRVKCR